MRAESEGGRLLFVSQGRIKGKGSTWEEGEKWLIDEQNLTDVKGYFIGGYCQNAVIYSLNDHVISNVAVLIDQHGEVFIGGPEVDQHRSEALQYRGGYRGYSRCGFGTVYYSEEGKDYEEWGYWRGEQPKGKFIKEHYHPESPEYFLISYQAQKWSEVRIANGTDGFFRVRSNSERGVLLKQKLTETELLTIMKEIEDYRDALLKQHKQLDFMGRVSEHPLYCSKFDNEELESVQKLTHDQCEVYLQYLFHQEESQLTEKTAILGLYVVEIYQRLREKSNDFGKYSKELTRLMLKFQGRCSILGGFWRRIVIPLVFIEGDHYSFAVIDPHEHRCTFYNSIRGASTVREEGLIRQLLIDQAGRNGNFESEVVSKLTFSSSNDIPEQFDSISCGFYMLWGIKQLLKEGKITFSNHQLPAIKEEVLRKLKEINRKPEELEK